MRSTCSRQSILNVLVPIDPVLLSPSAKPPHTFPKPVSHTSFSSGYFDNRLYDVIISPVFECITSAQKCWRFSWECISSIVLVLESWLSFVSLEFVLLHNIHGVLSSFVGIPLRDFQTGVVHKCSSYFHSTHIPCTPFLAGYILL